MGTLPDFRTFPPDDLLGLFTSQRGYLQGYKTSKIASVAICGRSCHIMPVLYSLYVCMYNYVKIMFGVSLESVETAISRQVGLMVE